MITDGISFEWDPDKSSTNELKHGISFEEAAAVFYDEAARLIADPDAFGDEERFVILGMSLKLRILAVCHCYRKEDSAIRIISVRRATKSETRQYEEHFS